MNKASMKLASVLAILFNGAIITAFSTYLYVNGTDIYIMQIACDRIISCACT